MRLTSQRRLGHFRSMRNEDTSVSRNAVAGFQQQQVARNEFKRRNLGELTIATDAGNRRQHVFQSRQRRLGPMLLHKAHHGIG